MTKLNLIIETIKISTFEVSKITDLRVRPKTADHRGAVLLFEPNSLTYASYESFLLHESLAFELNIFCSISHYPPIDTEPVLPFELNISCSTSHYSSS